MSLDSGGGPKPIPSGPVAMAERRSNTARNLAAAGVVLGAGGLVFSIINSIQTSRLNTKADLAAEQFARDSTRNVIVDSRLAADSTRDARFDDRFVLVEGRQAKTDTSLARLASADDKTREVLASLGASIKAQLDSMGVTAQDVARKLASLDSSSAEARKVIDSLDSRGFEDHIAIFRAIMYVRVCDAIERHRHLKGKKLPNIDFDSFMALMTGPKFLGVVGHGGICGERGGEYLIIPEGPIVSLKNSWERWRVPENYVPNLLAKDIYRNWCAQNGVKPKF